MTNKEWKKQFLEICADFINGKSTVINDQDDMEKLINCAKKQNLESVLYCQLHEESLKQKYYHDIIVYHNHLKEMNIIKDIFNDRKIEYFFVKGFLISSLYPVSEARTMGDIDIIIKTADKEKVKNLLISNGWITSENDEKRETYFYKYGFLYEVHTNLLYEDERTTRKILEINNEVWNHIVDHQLEWNYHFLFLLLHLRKHIMGEGTGIRQFIDLALVIKKCNLDWNIITEKTMKYGIFEFMQVVLDVLEDWFNIERPIQNDLKLKTDINYITNKIFDDGLFGKLDSDNKNNLVRLKGRKESRKIMAREFLNDLFLPYERMCRILDYHYLIRHKALLPVAWLHRILKNIHNCKSIRERYFIFQKEINDRDFQLQKWNL